VDPIVIHPFYIGLSNRFQRRQVLDGLEPGGRARGAESLANYLLLVTLEIEISAWMNGERREAAPMPGPKAEHNWNSRRILRRQSHEKLIRRL